MAPMGYFSPCWILSKAQLPQTLIKLVRQLGQVWECGSESVGRCGRGLWPGVGESLTVWEGPVHAWVGSVNRCGRSQWTCVGWLHSVGVDRCGRGLWAGVGGACIEVWNKVVWKGLVLRCEREVRVGVQHLCAANTPGRASR